VAENAAVPAVREGPATPIPASCRPGEPLGRYRVVEKIGSGGFGAVYRGLDPVLRRDVAIKTCEVASLEVRARFEREARLAARLRHPLITTVYDFGFEGGVPFIVCEFLEGADLDEVFTRTPDLPLLEKLDILIAVAGALECAHGAGVLHRDVKPGNVRVLPDGSVKLMDFGIAKSIFVEENLTRAGTTVGSSAYMSPEQARGEPLDARTDLFSLGVLSYELLAGRKPFRDPDLMRLLEKIAMEEPDPLGSIAPHLPRSLASLVHRCLAKDRDARPASAEEIRLALRAIRAEVLAAAGLSPAPPSAEDLAAEIAPAPTRRIGLRAQTFRRLRPSIARLAAALLLLTAAGLMLYSLRRDGITALRFPELRRAPVVRWAPPPARLSP
jgi:eukaryotic-like serine/threonine-protein kinase